MEAHNCRKYQTVPGKGKYVSRYIEKCWTGKAKTNNSICREFDKMANWSTERKVKWYLLWSRGGTNSIECVSAVIELGSGYRACKRMHIH